MSKFASGTLPEGGLSRRNDFKPLSYGLLMRTANLLLRAIVPMIAALAAACSDDGSLGPDPEPFGSAGFGVAVEGGGEIVFDSRATNAFDVAVTPEGKWQASRDAGWINVELHKGGFTVTADRNRTLSDRRGVITVTCGSESETIDVRQTAGTLKVYTVDGTSYGGVAGVPGKAVSANGRYAMGSSSAGTWVCDLEALGEVSDGIIRDGNVRFYNLFGCTSVTDFGEPVAAGCTADGSSRVETETVAGLSTAYLVHDGVKTALYAPYEAQVGTITPHGGYEAYWISDDGRYVAGKHKTGRGDRTECGWRYDGSTGEWVYVFYPEGVEIDSDEWGVSTFWFDAMSPGGKYTCGRVQGWARSEQVYPYVRNLETGELKILTNMGGLSASMVTDDGFVSVAGMLGDTRIYDMNNPDAGLVPLPQWLGGMFGFDPETYDMEPGLIYARGVNSERSAACWTFRPGGDPQALMWSMILVVE